MPTATSVKIFPSLNPTTFGRDTPITAQVYDAAGVNPIPSATGVMFFYDSGVLFASLALQRGGSVSATYTPTSFGDRVISVQYSGDPTYSGSSASVLQPGNVPAEVVVPKVDKFSVSAQVDPQTIAPGTAVNVARKYFGWFDEWGIQAAVTIRGTIYGAAGADIQLLIYDVGSVATFLGGFKWIINPGVLTSYYSTPHPGNYIVHNTYLLLRIGSVSGISWTSPLQMVWM